MFPIAFLAREGSVDKGRSMGSEAVVAKDTKPILSASPILSANVPAAFLASVSGWGGFFPSLSILPDRSNTSMVSVGAVQLPMAGREMSGAGQLKKIFFSSPFPIASSVVSEAAIAFLLLSYTIAEMFTFESVSIESFTIVACRCGEPYGSVSERDFTESVCCVGVPFTHCGSFSNSKNTRVGIAFPTLIFGSYTTNCSPGFTKILPFWLARRLLLLSYSSNLYPIRSSPALKFLFSIYAARS